jgi:hypothetical protein
MACAVRMARHADAALRGRGLTGPTPIPSYVQRWLITSLKEPWSGATQRKAADILTEACHAYYRLYALPVRFELRRGVTMESPGRDAETLKRLETWAGDGVCVFNGVFAWLFELPKQPDAQEQFRAWLVADWFTKRKVVDSGGWPVICLPKGEWPIDPRLIPGSPLALPQLVMLAARPSSPRPKSPPQN